MIAHELDDLDRAQQFCFGEHHWQLWWNGIQPHLDS